jgi:hypothetical protein
MTHAREMLASSPSPIPGVDVAPLADAAEAAFDCVQTCTACANACLGEPNVQEMVRCIRLNLHCADLCDTTGRLISRQENPELARAILRACVLACRLCAEECERHGYGALPHLRGGVPPLRKRLRAVDGGAAQLRRGWVAPSRQTCRWQPVPGARRYAVDP